MDSAGLAVRNQNSGFFIACFGAGPGIKSVTCCGVAFESVLFVWNEPVNTVKQAPKVAAGAALGPPPVFSLAVLCMRTPQVHLLCKHMAIMPLCPWQPVPCRCEDEASARCHGHEWPLLLGLAFIRSCTVRLSLHNSIN